MGEFVKAQKFLAKVSDSYFINENENFLLVKFELTNPDRIVFQSGQYVSLRVNAEGERRSYSIVSTPDVNHGFSLLAEIVPNGKGSQYLQSLNPGAEVEIMAPMGRFVVQTGSDKLLLVATGSGIAPIYSMIEDLLINKRDVRPMRLHWGMRDEKHLFWFDNLQRLSEEHKNFVFDVVLSTPSEAWSLCSGHVQDCLGRDFDNEDLIKWGAYICGNPKMVTEVSELLIKMGMPESNVNHEKFS